MDALMLLLLVLGLCSSSCGEAIVRQLSQVGQEGVVYAAAPVERGAYAVGTGGHYNYGYNTGDGIAKVEVRRPDGSVVGSYRYFDPTGKQVVRSYIADKRGFRVLGNDLPISPDTPASQVLGSPAFTAPVEGTAEFAIPPPLTSNSPNPQPPSRHQLQVQLHQRQVEQQQLEQQRVLEAQRKQLREEQKKLAKLQKKLEAQQLKVQQQLQQSTSFTQQPSSFSVQQHQKLPQQQWSQQQGYSSQTRNHLTGGYTSPYYYFDQQLNYDFPAGFAYPGMLGLRPAPPAPAPSPFKATYIIGKAPPGFPKN